MTYQAKQEAWLVYYDGHDDGIHPEAVYSTEEQAKDFIENAPYSGVTWQYMPIDLDP